MTNTKQFYTKDFLDGLDAALIRCSDAKSATTLIYRRSGQLDIRVKIDQTPPTSTPQTVIYQAAP